MAVSGQVVIRPMMYLALSLRPPGGGRQGRGDLPGQVKEALEDPQRLLLDV